MKKHVQKFMRGRYGVDQLGTAILVLSFISYIFLLFNFYLLGIFSFPLMILFTYRMLSKNIMKRQQENRKFMAFAGPQLQKGRLHLNRAKDKQFRYYKCKSCSQTIKVPRGKGKICITCPKCRTEFVKRT